MKAVRSEVECTPSLWLQVQERWRHIVLSAKKAGVIFMRLGWTSLPSLVRWSFTKRQLYYWRLAGSNEGLVVRLFRVRPIDFFRLAHGSPIATDLDRPMQRAMQKLDDPLMDAALKVVASEYPEVSNAMDILRVGLVKEISQENLDAFYADLWPKVMGWTSTVFVPASHWDSLLLSDVGEKQIVRGKSQLFLMGLVKTFTRITSGIGTRLHQFRFAASAHQPPRGESQDRRREQASFGRVLLVVNKGLSYGGLYAYKYFYSTDPQSFFYEGNVAVRALSNEAAGLNVLGVEPRGALETAKAWWRRVTLWARVCAGRNVFNFVIAWQMASTCEQARRLQVEVDRHFPDLLLAIYAYDIQVPPALTLALESLGVPSIAANERPQSLNVASQPFAVSTLLTATDPGAKRALENQAIAVREALPIGMWRTDLACQYQGRLSDEVWTRADRENLHRVLVLPYHVSMSETGLEHPFATSPPAVREFIEDVLGLIESNESVHAIIRGKDLMWLERPELKSLVNKIASYSRVEVNTEYSRKNESYRLLAGAELVIAKYTSLVDEALAIGVPCLVHDYVGPFFGMGRSVAPHLSEDVFATSRIDFEQKFKSGSWKDGSLDQRRTDGAQLCTHADGQVGVRFREHTEEVMRQLT